MTARDGRVRLPVGAVVVFPDATVYRVGGSGELVPLVHGGYAHGEMNTAPVATRRPE